LPALFFGYLGISNATQTGGEAKNANSNLPKAVLVTGILVTIIYTVFAAAVYHVIPWQIINGLNASGHSNMTSVPALMGLFMPHWLSATLNFAVALIVIKSIIPMLLAQSRWLYAWASDGIIPSIFARTSVKYGTPILGLTISALLGSLSLLESVKAGFIFGIGERVLSVMIVLFLLGVGMLFIEHGHAADRLKNSSSYLIKYPVIRNIVACLLILVSVWFSYGLIKSSLHSPIYLQPVFQAVVVLIIGILIYSSRKGRYKDIGIESQKIKS